MANTRSETWATLADGTGPGGPDAVEGVFGRADTIGVCGVGSGLPGGGTVNVAQPAKDRPVTITVGPTDRSELDTIVKLERDGSAMEIAPIDAASANAN